jgi:hypothetical protein
MQVVVLAFFHLDVGMGGALFFNPGAALVGGFFLFVGFHPLLMLLVDTLEKF